MVSSDKKKPSVSGQPNAAALVTVAGSELDFYTNSNYLAFESPQYAAAQRQGKLGSDDVDDDLSVYVEQEDTDLGDTDNATESEGGEEEKDNFKGVPSLSDIEVISSEVVYDSANNPTAKVVFRIKNSSGVELKAVNVRVEKK